MGNIAAHKTFNGKRYTYIYTRHTKANAKVALDQKRIEGWLARMSSRKVDGKTHYDIYIRAK